jgi:hypothetical protein
MRSAVTRLFSQSGWRACGCQQICPPMPKQQHVVFLLMRPAQNVGSEIDKTDFDGRLVAYPGAAPGWRLFGDYRPGLPLQR